VRQERALLGERVGDDVGVSRAADVEQQARVVRLHRGFLIDAEAVTEPHRDQGAVQAVFERQAKAEIRGQ
jgi:hypothetical protein